LSSGGAPKKSESRLCRDMSTYHHSHSDQVSLKIISMSIKGV
jgi:hypothetical protein